MIARAVLLIASLSVSVLLVEAGLTVTYLDDFAWGPLERVPEWRSPFLFRVREGEGANAQGMRRAQDIREGTPRESIRILSYGDSISDGYRLDNHETYAAALEGALNNHPGRPFEVLNMLRGHSPTVHSFHLRVDVPRFEPDAVLLQIELSNDVSDEARIATKGLDAAGLPLRIDRARYLVGWDGYLLAPLALRGSPLERTKTYAKLSRWFGRLLNRVDPNPLFEPGSEQFFYSSYADRALLTNPNLDAGFERLFTSIAGMQRYLDARGVRFLLLILPPRHAFETSPYRASARALIERAEQAAIRQGIPFVSALSALDGQGGAALYMDFCHPTADGNRAIAALLEPVVGAFRGEGR